MKREKRPVFWMFQIAPWLNVLVVATIAIIISGKIGTQRGVSFELPAGDASVFGADGRIVMLPADSGEMTLIFYEDVRYRIAHEDELAQLAEQIAGTIAKSYGRGFLLLADKNVPHGDVMTVVNILRSAGAAEIRVGLRQ